MKSINDKELRFEAIMRELREGYLDAFAMLGYCPVCKKELVPGLFKTEAILGCEDHGRFVITWTDGAPVISWHFRVQEKMEKEYPTHSFYIEQGGLGEFFQSLFWLIVSRKAFPDVKWRNVEVHIWPSGAEYSFRERNDDGMPINEWKIPEMYHAQLRENLPSPKKGT